MTAEAWWAFVATAFVLVSVPGPSQLLMVSNTLANGLRRAAATTAGDLSANLLQMLAATAGLGALVARAEPTYRIVQWCGVAYLGFLGVGRMGAGLRAVASLRAPRTARALWWDGFITSAANPKAVLFFVALFPQFIDWNGSLWIQVAVLGVTYLVLDGVCLMLYGLASSRIGHAGIRTGAAAPGNGVNRLSGAALIVASLLLALKAAG